MALLPDTVGGYPGGRGLSAGAQAGQASIQGGLAMKEQKMKLEQQKRTQYIDQYKAQKDQSMKMISSMKSQIDSDYLLKKRQVDSLKIEDPTKKTEMLNALEAGYQQKLQAWETTRTGVFDSLHKSIIQPMAQLGYLPPNQADMDRQQFSSISPLRQDQQAYLEALPKAEVKAQEASAVSQSDTYYIPGKGNQPGTTKEILKTDLQGQQEAMAAGGYKYNASVQASSTGELSKPVVTDVQKKLIAVQESLGKIREIRAEFKPEFLTIGGRVSQLASKLGEKFGVKDIPKEDKKTFEDYRKFGQKSLMFLNEEIHRLTGAQLSQFEAARIRGSLPDFGEGVFSGNSPTEFQANLDSTEQTLMATEARYKFLLEHGVIEQGQEMTDQIAKQYPLESFKVPKEKTATQQFSEGQTATNSKTGEKLIYRNGQWQPM